jgi:hypothetical protein
MAAFFTIVQRLAGVGVEFDVAAISDLSSQAHE